MGGRWAGDAHMHFAGAGGGIISTILVEVVPRTMESSTNTTRLALDHGAVGVVLQLDAQMADRIARLDKGTTDNGCG